MYPRPRFLLPVLLVIAVAAGAAVTQLRSRGAEALTGAVLDAPVADCSLGSASVTLRWSPVQGATQQWIEYSLQDNDFAEGTFDVIPVDPAATSQKVQAASTTLPNYWRVVSTTSNGSLVSATGSFMACGGPILLWGPIECNGFSSATLRFRWSPLAKVGGVQYLEYDNDGDFAGTDLISVGPLAPWQERLDRSGFHAGESYYFRVVRVEADGTRLNSQVGYFVPDCTPTVNPDLYGSDDRLIAPRLGINAPVNLRDVGNDGALGVPEGAYDVVRYNFPLFPSLGAVPGGKGTMLIAGHVDYYVVGLAVFAPLRNAQVGDVLEYWAGNVKYTYVVDWVADIPFSESLNSYLGGNGSSLLLITCNGVFNRAQYGGYNLRRLVHAALQ